MTKKETVIEAEASVIEDKGLAVTFTPALIEANFAALDARVDELIEGYADATYDLTKAENIKQAKRDRTYLNGIAKEIDERRKAVKREYMRPYDEFEAKANAITAKVKKASANIKVQLDEAEENRKDWVYSTLKEYYEDLAGLLAPVVPYERIHEEKWLNKTFGEVKAKKAIDEKVTKVAHDWDTLKAQKENLAHYEEAERTFFDTLDLGAALAAAHEAQEKDARIAEMRAAVESAQEATEPEEGSAEEPIPVAEPVSAPDPAPAVEQAPMVEPAPMTMPAPEPVPAPVMPQPAPAQPAPPVSQPAPVEPLFMPCVMVISSATKDQMREIGRFCGSLMPPVTGKFITGTLDEAYTKEYGLIGGING